MERVVALHRAAAQRKGLEVSAEFDEQMPETLLIDSTKLVQILNNLVHNAVKFTTEGGIRVKVSGDVMPFASSTPGRELRKTSSSSCLTGSVSWIHSSPVPRRAAGLALRWPRNWQN